MGSKWKELEGEHGVINGAYVELVAWIFFIWRYGRDDLCNS